MERQSLHMSETDANMGDWWNRRRGRRLQETQIKRGGTTAWDGATVTQVLTDMGKGVR